MLLLLMNLSGNEQILATSLSCGERVFGAYDATD